MYKTFSAIQGLIVDEVNWQQYFIDIKSALLNKTKSLSWYDLKDNYHLNGSYSIYKEPLFVVNLGHTWSAYGITPAENPEGTILHEYIHMSIIPKPFVRQLVYEDLARIVGKDGASEGRKRLIAIHVQNGGNYGNWVESYTTPAHLTVKKVIGVLGMVPEEVSVFQFGSGLNRKTGVGLMPFEAGLDSLYNVDGVLHKKGQICSTSPDRKYRKCRVREGPNDMVLSATKDSHDLMPDRSQWRHWNLFFKAWAEWYVASSADVRILTSSLSMFDGYLSHFAHRFGITSSPMTCSTDNVIRMTIQFPRKYKQDGTDVKCSSFFKYFGFEDYNNARTTSNAGSILKTGRGAEY